MEKKIKDLKAEISRTERDNINQSDHIKMLQKAMIKESTTITKRPEANEIDKMVQEVEFVNRKNQNKLKDKINNSLSTVEWRDERMTVKVISSIVKSKDTLKCSGCLFEPKTIADYKDHIMKKHSELLFEPSFDDHKSYVQRVKMFNEIKKLGWKDKMVEFTTTKGKKGKYIGVKCPECGHVSPLMNGRIDKYKYHVQQKHINV